MLTVLVESAKWASATRSYVRLTPTNQNQRQWDRPTPLRRSLACTSVEGGYHPDAEVTIPTPKAAGNGFSKKAQAWEHTWSDWRPNQRRPPAPYCRF